VTSERNPAQSPDPTLRHALRQVTRAFSAKLTAQLNEHGVSEAEYVSMFALRRIPNMSNADLSRWTGVSPQGTNEVLKNLITNGLVERQRSPQHARILEARLTEHGNEVIAACEDAANSLEAVMCAQLRPDEVTVLEDLLRRCADGLGAPIGDRAAVPARLVRP
jgi:DNA-binding MarR family transcriptional regulator